MKKSILARDGESLATAFIVHSLFPLDPFQLEAISHLEADKSVLVAAPTSAGKTVIAEFAIERALQSGQHVIYTAPIKALSNQKFADFGRRWGFERVGLLTGDIAINKNAPVRVMTTEVLRNMLLQAPDGVRDVQTVVLDEFHYLADPERGRVWEEIVILLPSDVQLVCLSASMANATQLREWMSRVHGETALVTHPLRPVPLEVHYFAHGVLQLVVDAQGRQVRALRVGGEERRSRRHWSGTGSPARAGDQARAKAPIAADVIAELRDRHLLPAIYFVFNRARTESEAALSEGSLDLVTHQEARNIIQQAVAETTAQLPPEAHVLPQVRTLFNLLTRGIAFHHAGLLPALKVLVENLFSQGVLGVVFATETLALGINMPARSVVIPQLTKFDGSTRRPLSGREFQQLIGRAGRRGMDIAGHAVLVHDPMMTFDEAMTIVRRPLEPVMSSFSLTYNSLTNLLLTYGDPQVLARLMNRSLLAFQLVTRRRRFEIQLSKLQQQLLDIPIQCPACGHAQPATHCPRHREHMREARQRRQLLFHITELEQEVERAKTMEQRDLHHTVEDALAVLTHFGYVKDGTCTDDGEVLARLIDPNALLLSELVLGPELDSVTPSQLAEVLSWFAQPDGEPHSELLTDALKLLWRSISRVTAAVQARELETGVVVTRGPAPVFPGLAERWCEGSAFTELFQGLKVAEGDIIRYLKKTADLLRQVAHALGETGRKPHLQHVAEEAEGLVRRDLVRLQELVDWEGLEEVPQVEAAIQEENALLAALAEEAREEELSAATLAST